MSLSPAPYSLFLTGVTGFVGKVVLAELLRCKRELGVERVYVLIRPKRGKSPQARFDEGVVGSPVFAKLPAGWSDAVVPLAGELTEPDAGLSAQDLLTLRQHVTHVIHCAASVEFDLPIRQAAAANISSALGVLELARSCQGLKRMVSVSTAYVTPWRANQGPIPEALAPLPFPAAATYDAILADTACEDALMRESGHPNTYTLTKSIAEHLLVERRGDVPLSIVRPSIISATLRHPLPGWIDSPAALGAFVLLVGSGMMKVVVGDINSDIDVVPCDIVSDRVIAEVFQTEPLRIRHAVAGPDHSLNVRKTLKGVVEYFGNRPMERRPSARVLLPGPRFRYLAWRHNTLPAKLTGLVLRLAGKKELGRRAVKAATKVGYVNSAFPYFTTHRFAFTSAEPWDAAGFKRRAYVRQVCQGLDAQVFKRPASATTLAGKKHKDGSRSDLAWALRQPKGSAAVRFLGYVIRKGSRRVFDQITYDREAFERAVAAIPPGASVALAPTHRSYADFLLCSYLCFAAPELGLRIPYIAAAEEFKRIPLLGAIFTAAQAFYVKRGAGAQDPELGRQVAELADRDEVIEFFIEGARSRSRRFLRPRTGLLRCMQATQRTYALLPIAITYDRVPEERVLARELSGAPKPPMRLRELFGWAGRVFKGEVSLGRIHLGCGLPVVMTPESDVTEVARETMASLQANQATTTHHLRCFLKRVNDDQLTESWLREALEARGGLVIDSSLGFEERMDVVTEVGLREQWLPWFYPDALARWPQHPVLRHDAQARDWQELAPVAAPTDSRLTALLDALFAPMLQDTLAVLAAIGTPATPLQHGTPAALLAASPGIHLLHVQAVYEAFVAANILSVDAETRLHTWGPASEHLDGVVRACRAIAPIHPPGELVRRVVTSLSPTATL